MTPNNNRGKLIASITLVGLTAIIIIGSILSRSKTSNTARTVASTTAATTKTAGTTKDTCTTASLSSATLKDGTYKTTGSYSSPGGIESIGVSITLSGNIVTAANVTSESNDPTAQSYQSYFINGYKSEVIGKKISSIHLSNVSGSSLTSQGFNQALKNIACQADQA
jgi:uncharacterized protein with FMN-binding domain